MKKPISWKAVRWAVFVAVLILVVIGAAFPTGGVTLQGARWVSFHRMQEIAQGLYAFGMDHGGSMPHRLAELLPDYLGDPIAFFPDREFSHSFTPENAASHPELIDLFSPYCFFKLPDGRIVVAERPGLWDDGMISYAVLGNDGKPIGDGLAYHVLPKEFEERLKKNLPGSPDLSGNTGASESVE